MLLDIYSIYGTVPRIYPWDWDFKIDRALLNEFFIILGAKGRRSELLIKSIESEDYCLELGYKQKDGVIIGIDSQWNLLPFESLLSASWYIKLMRNSGYPASTITILIPTHSKPTGMKGKVDRYFLDFTLCDNIHVFETMDFHIGEFGNFPVIHPRHLIDSFSYMLKPELDANLNFSRLELEQQQKIKNAGRLAFDKNKLRYTEWLELEEKK